MSLYERISYDEVNRGTFASLREHDRMLADTARLDAYYSAIRKHVKAGDAVVDLGTGSGILALIAAANAPRAVYAIDHSDIIEIARSAAVHNRIDGIEFRKIHSRSLTLEEEVDVIIHEQLGDFLFEENMVENVIDLRDRLLKPGGRILPNRFALFVEPVSLKDEYRIPFTWENNLFGFDFGFVKQFAGRQARDYHYRSIVPCQVSHLLCEPRSIMEFDLETVSPEDLPKRLYYQRETECEGTLDGFALYFVAKFDEEISFSNSPTARNTNWVGRLLRVESQRLQQGARLALDLQLEDIANPNSWTWSVDLAPPCARSATPF